MKVIRYQKLKKKLELNKAKVIKVLMCSVADYTPLATLQSMQSFKVS